MMTLDEMPLWASLVIKPRRPLRRLRIDGDAASALVAPPGPQRVSAVFVLMVMRQRCGSATGRLQRVGTGSSPE